jgi:hypothetical protein
MATHPYAGLAWMHMQITAGFARLGHDVYYIEASSSWPFDPVRNCRVNDGLFAVPYVARMAEWFGLSDRWAFRTSFSDREWFGLSQARAEELLATADAVLNISGASHLRTTEGLKVGNLVYVGTDPVFDEVAYAAGEPWALKTVAEHDVSVTYGENIGTPASPVPPLPKLMGHTRQPVLMDLWASAPPSRRTFTTVSNWKMEGHDIEFQGEKYFYSKHREFLKFLELPRRTGREFELAMGLKGAEPTRNEQGEIVWKRPGQGNAILAIGMTTDERQQLFDHGWQMADAHTITMALEPYRDYIQESLAEFTVAKDQYARLRSGWFSERSACYLAAGRPVITQDTGFGRVLPTGEGLFAFNTIEEAQAAVEAVTADYDRHSRAARGIAAEYFASERVLPAMLKDLGL